MPFIDFSLFAFLDLTDQMGHLTLVMEKKENKKKTRLGQFVDLSVVMEIMFSVAQGAFPLGKGLLCETWSSMVH